MSRPVCVHCGKPYGSRNTRFEKITWPQNESPPRYQGNEQLIKQSDPSILWIEAPRQPVHHLGMHKLVDSGKLHMRRELWDGESWHGGYKPFCTLRCALDYARRAYANR